MELNIYSTAAYILIATAAVAAVLSFLGCCGAAKVLNSTVHWCTAAYSLIVTAAVAAAKYILIATVGLLEILRFKCQ